MTRGVIEIWVFGQTHPRAGVCERSNFKRRIRNNLYRYSAFQAPGDAIWGSIQVISLSPTRCISVPGIQKNWDLQKRWRLADVGESHASGSQGIDLNVGLIFKDEFVLLYFGQI